MADSNFSFTSTNNSGLRKRGIRCWCDLESPLMTSWTHENPGRRFHGCGNFKVIRKKGCNYFQWVDEEMSSRAKEMVRSLKDKNEELMDLIRDTKKNEEMLKMKTKFLGYFLILSLLLLLLVVFVFVTTHV